jgi:aspartyl-tRNA(Asn)/glutamyl-tRNA(Gln) amidotransferase subunit B
VEVDDAWLSDIRSRLCELPLQMQNRFMTEYGLNDYDAGVLTADRATAEFFDKTIKQGADAKRVCNLMTQTGLKLANEKGVGVDNLGISIENLANLARMIDAGDVSATAATAIFEEMAAGGGDPMQIAEAKNLIQKSDAGELEALVDQVLAENAQAVEDAKSNPKKGKKAMGFLMGQVMQKSKGQANPKVVSKLLHQKLQ